MTSGHESGNPWQSTQGFMQLTIGMLSLLLPMEQVVSLESVLDITLDESEAGRLGKIIVGGTGRPVYNLGEDLQLVDELTEARKVCVCLDHDENGYGIVCDQVNTVLGTEVELVALPACMETDNTPIHTLAIKDKHVMSVTDAGAVRRLISQLQQAH